MSSPGKLHDPLFHYDTHYPERLSRFHGPGSEFGPAGSFKKSRKSRQRAGIRYKTQPVTFDEITEVDEEPAGAGGESGGEENTAGRRKAEWREGAGRGGRGLMMGQFQTFSRSMDGLLPGIPEQGVQAAQRNQGLHRDLHRVQSIEGVQSDLQGVQKDLQDIRGNQGTETDLQGAQGVQGAGRTQGGQGVHRGQGVQQSPMARQVHAGSSRRARPVLERAACIPERAEPCPGQPLPALPTQRTDVSPGAAATTTTTAVAATSTVTTAATAAIIPSVAPSTSVVSTITACSIATCTNTSTAISAASSATTAITSAVASSVATTSDTTTTTAIATTMSVSTSYIAASTSTTATTTAATTAAAAAEQAGVGESEVRREPTLFPEGEEADCEPPTSHLASTVTETATAALTTSASGGGGLARLQPCPSPEEPSTHLATSQLASATTEATTNGSQTISPGLGAEGGGGGGAGGGGGGGSMASSGDGEGYGQKGEDGGEDDGKSSPLPALPSNVSPLRQKMDERAGGGGGGGGPGHGGRDEGEGKSSPLPVPPSSVGPRRQKMTAKAKKRQKQGEGERGGGRGEGAGKE